MGFGRRIMGGDDERPWRDTMLVCLEGHVITDSLKSSPELAHLHCDKDGALTISACSSCNAAIPGEMHYPDVVSFGGAPTAPECCVNCGQAFPWTGKSAKPQTSGIPVEDLLTRLFERFPLVVRQLRQRHAGRETIDVGDEYDVQDLTHALLCIGTTFAKKSTRPAMPESQRVLTFCYPRSGPSSKSRCLEKGSLKKNLVMSCS